VCVLNKEKEKEERKEMANNSIKLFTKSTQQIKACIQEVIRRISQEMLQQVK